MILFLTAFALTSWSGFAAEPATLDLRIAATFSKKVCSDSGTDPIEAARIEIEKFKKEKKTKKATNALIAAWLKDERESDKEIPSLGWLRVIDPWALPENFPAKTALENCSSELRTYSDDRTKANLEEWKSCLDLIFAEVKPAEFTALKACLDQQVFGK